jgi:hypothetical protein
VSFGSFGYAAMLRILPSNDGGVIRLQVFADRSIVEIFGYGARFPTGIYTLEDAIGSHACSLEKRTCV